MSFTGKNWRSVDGLRSLGLSAKDVVRGCIAWPYKLSSHTYCSVPCRYLLAVSDTTLFAAFVGTKFPRDLLVDATFLEELVWQDLPFAEATDGQVTHKPNSVAVLWEWHQLLCLGATDLQLYLLTVCLLSGPTIGTPRVSEPRQSCASGVAIP